MNSTNLVVLGAGGFARETLDVIEAINHSGRASLRVAAVLADPEPQAADFRSYVVGEFGSLNLLRGLPSDFEFVVAIGSPSVRRSVVASAKSLRPASALVHPSATLGSDVRLGAGVVICSGARLTTNIEIGAHSHINLNCTVGHDVSTGEFVTLSPQVALSGRVAVGAGVFLGTGAVVNPSVSLGDAVTVGAGAVVIRDVPQGVTVAGVPATELASHS